MGLLRKSKKEENEKTATLPIEGKEVVDKTYLKAMPLRDLSDLDTIKNEVKNGNILILRITPLASKDIEDVKQAVNELYEFAEAIGGDIARLGEERVVICPHNIRIWRENEVPELRSFEAPIYRPSLEDTPTTVEVSSATKTPSTYNRLCNVSISYTRPT